MTKLLETIPRILATIELFPGYLPRYKLKS